MKNKLSKIIRKSYRNHLTDVKLTKLQRFYTIKSITYQIITKNALTSKRIEYNNWLNESIEKIKTHSDFDNAELEHIQFRVGLIADEIQRKIIESKEFHQFAYIEMLTDDILKNMNLKYILSSLYQEVK